MKQEEVLESLGGLVGKTIAATGLVTATYKVGSIIALPRYLQDHKGCNILIKNADAPGGFVFNSAKIVNIVCDDTGCEIAYNGKEGRSKKRIEILPVKF